MARTKQDRARTAPPAGILRAEEIQDRRERYTPLTIPLKDLVLWGRNLASISDELLQPRERLEQLARVRNGAHLVSEGVSVVSGNKDFLHSAGPALQDALDQFLLDSGEALNMLTELERLALLTKEIRGTGPQSGGYRHTASGLAHGKTDPTEELHGQIFAFWEKLREWSKPARDIAGRTALLLKSVEIELDLLKSTPTSAIDPLEKLENLVWAICMDSLKVCVIMGECVLEFASEGRPFLPPDVHKKLGKSLPYRIPTSPRLNGEVL